MLADPGNRARAPEPLRVVQAFVNTRDIENDVDELSTPAALARVLEEIGAPAGGAAPLTASDLAVAIEAREALRALALVPQTDGLAAGLGRILAVVHDSMTDGTWWRFKACPRDVCHWAFYDRSRNGSGKWCSMSVCGNRTNTKAYRRRAASRG